MKITAPAFLFLAIAVLVHVQDTKDVLVHAQTATKPAPVPVPPPPAINAPPPNFQPCSNDRDPATNLTGCQALAIHDLMQQEAPYLQALQPIDAKLRELEVAIVRANPGMVYDRPSQQFPFGRLVKRAAPPAVSTPPAKPTK